MEAQSRAALGGSIELHNLKLPGVSGNYANTPDTAGNSITGDMEVRALVALYDWTPGAAMTIMAKNAGANQLSWRFGVDTSGNLTYAWSTLGVAFVVTKTSTSAVVAGDGQKIWVRVTMDVDNGAAGNDGAFYTSTTYNPDTNQGTWSQLGTTVTTATATSIFDSTSILELGSETTGTGNLLNGRIYRAQLYSGINGTLIADFNVESAKRDAATFTATTGEVWTITSTGANPAHIA